MCNIVAQYEWGATQKSISKMQKCSHPAQTQKLYMKHTISKIWDNGRLWHLPQCLSSSIFPNEQAKKHYLNQWCHSFLTHISITWPFWVNSRIKKIQTCLLTLDVLALPDKETWLQLEKGKTCINDDLQGRLCGQVSMVTPYMPDRQTSSKVVKWQWISEHLANYCI